MHASTPPRHSLPARLTQVINANHGTARGWVRALLSQTEYVLGRLEPFVAPAHADVQRLVFVCLGNINRSAFAEQVARSLGARTCSIGLSTTTGAPAFDKAQEFAPRFGLDLSQHRATNMSDYARQPGDLLLAMETRHARQLVAAGVPPACIALLGHWSSPHRIHLHDPHTLSDAYFKTCFTLIQSAVRGLAEDLRSHQSPCIAR